MALLTIVEASKQFKIARSHLYKKINDGELSTQLNENGTKVIQYVDLLRVFGESSTSSLKTTEDSPQVVVEDKIGQPLRSSEYKRKISLSLVIFSIFICLVLLGTITALYLRYIEGI